MCWLGVGLLFSPTTSAQSTEPSATPAGTPAKPASEPKPQPAPPRRYSPPSRPARGNGGNGSNGQRIQALEQKIFQAARYIEGLSRELQRLKRTAGVTSPPVAAPPPPGGAAPSAPPGTQHAFRQPTPQTPSRRRAESERLEEEEEVSRDQERIEPQAGFLRQARAVLIAKGRLEIDPTLTYRHTNRHQLLIRGVDLIENIFIGNIEVSRLQRTVLTTSASFRYGLTNRIQLNLAVPYQRAFRKFALEPAVQRQLGEETETKESDAGLGDIEAGLSVHLLREGEWLPDMIVTVGLKSDTGTSPFDVDAGSLATGTGFWGLRTGATFVKVSDPAVLFLSGGYFYHHPKDDVEGFGEVEPPDGINYGFGLSYALNPYLSLTTRFSGGLTDKTVVEGIEIDGSDQVSASLGLGITYALSGRTSLDLSAEFGLTDDSPDFTIRVSTPMSFSLPSLGDWKSWRLSQILRF